MTALGPKSLATIPEWPQWIKTKHSGEIIWWTQLEGTYYELDIIGSMRNPLVVLREFDPQNYYTTPSVITHTMIYIGIATEDFDAAIALRQQMSEDLLTYLVLTVV